MDEARDACPRSYNSYWRITLDFLKIAFAHWPEWLAERGLIDRAKRVALLIENEIKAVEGGAGRGPTIIAGSTGANRATARLIAAIARSAQGAVVLPGLDLNLDDRAWAMIGASDEVARARGPPAGAAAQADRRDRRQTRGRGDPRLAVACACVALGLRERSAPSGRNRPTAGAIASARCRRPRSPRRSGALRSSSPTTRTKRPWRWRSPCAKRSKRRARPQPSSRPIRPSRAAYPRSLRDGASRSRIRPGARWGKAPRACSPG